jgi:hypothetical protein
MRAAWVVGTLAAGMLGCGSDSETDGTGIGSETLEECLQSDIVLSCGTGETSFVPLTDGMEVPMVHGPQGGWHIWTSVQTQYSAQDVAILPTITIPSMGDLQISSTTPPGDFVALAYDVATCEGTYFGQQARLDPTILDADPAESQAVVCGLDRVPMHVRIDVTNLSDGRTASCEGDVVAVLDAGDVPICEGL